MKKNKIIMIMVTVGVIIAGGLIFVNSKKDYSSLLDIVVNMDISSNNTEKNIEVLKNFADKKNYTFGERDYDMKNVILLTIPREFDLLEYNIDSPSMSFLRYKRNDLSETERKKINKIKKNDSLKKVLSSLREPDKIERKGNGWFQISWGSNEKHGMITFENRKVVEIELDD